MLSEDRREVCTRICTDSCCGNVVFRKHRLYVTCPRSGLHSNRRFHGQLMWWEEGLNSHGVTCTFFLCSSNMNPRWCRFFFYEGHRIPLSILKILIRLNRNCSLVQPNLSFSHSPLPTISLQVSLQQLLQGKFHMVWIWVYELRSFKSTSSLNCAEDFAL